MQIKAQQRENQLMISSRILDINDSGEIKE